MPVLWGRWSLGLPGAVGVTPRAVPTWVPAHVWGTLLVTPPTHSVPTASIRGTMRSGRARALGWLPLPLLLLLLLQVTPWAAGERLSHVREAPGGRQSGGVGRPGVGWGLPRVLPPAGGRPCSAKDFGHGSLVCVCSAAYCDAVEPVVLPGAGGFAKYESSKAGKRLQRTEGTFQRNAPTSGTATEPARLGKTSGIIGSNHRPLPPCPKTPAPSRPACP